jgi:hypothetical protein
MFCTGITGMDVISETVPPEEVVVEMRLGFGSCKLAVQGPVKQNMTSASQLAGKRIVTSFPNRKPSSCLQQRRKKRAEILHRFAVSHARNSFNPRHVDFCSKVNQQAFLNASFCMTTS